jgi:hypothetical protein
MTLLSLCVCLCIPPSLLGNGSVNVPLPLLVNGSVKIPLSLLVNGSVKIPLSLLGNCSVKITLSLLGNGSVKSPYVARQRLGRNAIAITDTHAAIEELFNPSSSMWPLSYQRK